MDTLPPYVWYEILTNGDSAIVNPAVLCLVNRRMRSTMETVFGWPLFWSSLAKLCFPLASDALLPCIWRMLATGRYGGGEPGDEKAVAAAWRAHLRYLLDGICGYYVCIDTIESSQMYGAAFSVKAALGSGRIALVCNLHTPINHGYEVRDVGGRPSMKFAVSAGQIIYSFTTDKAHVLPVTFFNCLRDDNVWKLKARLELSRVTPVQCIRWDIPPRALLPPVCDNDDDVRFDVHICLRSDSVFHARRVRRCDRLLDVFEPCRNTLTQATVFACGSFYVCAHPLGMAVMPSSGLYWYIGDLPTNLFNNGLLKFDVVR